MKGLSILVMSLVSGALILAHEGNEHVRGVVTQLSPRSITVQTTGKKTTTLKVTAKTTFQLAGKAATLFDLKVGDRILFGKWSGTDVVIDGEELLIMKESDVMGVVEGGAKPARKAA